MMYKNKNISVFQFAGLAFVSRLVCAFTGMPNLRVSLPATDRAAVFLLSLAFSLLFALPVLLCIGKKDSNSLLNADTFHTVAAKRTVFLFYALFFTMSAIIAVSQFGIFASSVLLQKTNLHLFIIVLIAAAVFCAERGLEPMARVGILLSAAVLGSLLFICVCNADKLQGDHLSRPFANGIQAIIREALFEACMNAELIVILFLAPQVSTKKKTVFLLWLPLCFLCIATAFLVSGAVMGHYADLQAFPLHSLAVIAKTKLFERVDDLLAGLWVACTVLKTGLLLYSADIAVHTAVPSRKKGTALILAGIAVFGGYLLLSSNIQLFARIMQSIAIVVIFLLASVFIPLVLYLLNSIRTRRNKKETKR